MKKNEGKGYTLKDNNNNGTYYIYIWGEYLKTESAERRRQGQKKASVKEGWKSLGPENDPQTWIDLREYLSNKRRLTEEEQEEIISDIEFEIEENKKIFILKEYIKNHFVEKSIKNPKWGNEIRETIISKSNSKKPLREAEVQDRIGKIMFSKFQKRIEREIKRKQPFLRNVEVKEVLKKQLIKRSHEIKSKMED